MKNKLFVVLNTVKTIVKYAGIVMVIYDTIHYFSERLSQYVEKDSLKDEKLSK